MRSSITKLSLAFLKEKHFAFILKVISHSIEKKIDFVSWESYHNKIEDIACNNFQQRTRKQSLKNLINNEKFFY